jgi:hypothetical protein
MLLVGLLLISPAAGAQAVRLAASAPRADLAAQLATLDPAGALRVVSTAADGTLRRVAGPLPLQGADVGARAADFAARFAPLFGADGIVVLGTPQPRQPRADGSPRAVFVPQLVQGWDVQGAGLTLALDEQGRATGAHGWLSAEAAQLGPPAITAEQAGMAALAHLGLAPADLRSQPKAQGVALASPAPALAWRVGFVQKAGLTPWRVDVDARTGAVLSARHEAYDGTGNIVLGGQVFTFPTVSGSGMVYKTASKAASDSEAGSSLTDLTGADIDEGLALLFGTLTGRYCTVSDFDAVLFNVFLAFDFSDTSDTLIGGVITEFEAFDHVDTYSWITRSAVKLKQIMGTLPSDTCIPVVVNVEGLINAFYSPDILDEQQPWAPGFFAFGDFDQATGDPFDDFSRDPTVVSHEYFHGMCDFAGLSFGDDAIDTPPRAVNEAIADYSSTSFHKTPEIGHAFVVHSGADLGIPGDALRDLTEEITLTDNLFDTIDPDNDLPEEHEAGKIFGCALWRLRTQAKQKPTDDLVVNHLADWPQSSAEVGFPDVTPANAQAAYEAFDRDCFVSLLNSALAPGKAKAWKLASKVLGAGLAHGILGSNVDNIVLLPTDTSPVTLNFKSAFLGSITEHAIGLQLVAGQKLSITLTGDKADGTQPDFAFTANPGDLDFPTDKVVNPAGTKVTQKNILVNVSNEYLLTLSTLNGAGAYKAVIKIK